MAAIVDTILPDHPEEIFKRITESDDPQHAALLFGRELMLLTEPEKKNFWYKAELNLLVLILLVAAGSCQVPPIYPHREMTKSEYAAWLMREPERLRELVRQKINEDPEGEKLLIPNFMAWQASTHGVSDNIAANLAVESEIVEYLLGKYKDWTR